MFSNDEVTFLFKSVFSNSNLAIVLTNQDGLITLFSKGAEEMLGYFSSEIELKQYSSFFFERESAEEKSNPFNINFSQNNLHDFSTVLIKKGGERLPVIINSNPINEMPGVLTIISNPSKNRHHTQLKEFSYMVTLSELTTAVAHEITNPLSIIQANTFFLLESVKKKEITNESILSYLTMAFNICERQEKIIKNLRSISYNFDEKYFYPTSITKLVEETINFFELRLKSQNIVVILDRSQKEIISNCSTIALYQVFKGLFDFAIESVKNLETKWIKIDLKLINDETYIECSMSTSGEKLLTNVFETTMKTVLSAKEPLSSEMVGIAIAHKIIEKYNGHFKPDQESSNFKIVFDIPLKQRTS